MDSILSVEAGAVNEIEGAAHSVPGGEGRPVWLTGAGAAEAVTIVTVISVTLFVPSRKSVHVHSLGRETHAHVTVTTLGDYLDLEVVEATRGWYGMDGPH